jgi:cytoskeletal protein RodZ
VDGVRSAGVNSRVGAVLRRAREARRLTLSDAAKGTYIWERYLQALEADASLEEFPARAYARSFLKAYAEFLELAALPLLREFDESHPAYEPRSLEPLPDPRPRRRVVATAFVAVSVVSLLAIVVVQSVAGRESRSVLGPPLAASAGASGPDPSALRSPPPVFSGIRAVLRLTQPCWVQVVADGRLLERSTLQPGDRVVFPARRLLELTLGNAGGVELEVEGEVLATGDLGEVVRLELRLRHGEVESTIV